MSTPTDLKALAPNEFEPFATSLGLPAFRGRQLFQWIYGKGVNDFGAMTNLSKDLRSRLEEIAVADRLEPARTVQASDGTMKALFTLSTGRQIESVLIPDFGPDGRARRLTVCVSSQVGCAMDCAFCATGQMGFQQNLTVGEIVDQVLAINDLAEKHFGRGISNVVYMGMGEPLLNYDAVLASIEVLTHPKALGLSPRRITLSTVGLARRIKQLADDQVARDLQIGLAVSLHAPNDEQRSAIMPVNRRAVTNLEALREAIRYYVAQTGQPLTYEYCLFRGVNDRPEDARQLAEVVEWAPSKVNLIMYNPVDGLAFERTSEGRLDTFVQELIMRGVTVTVRRSRGDEIDAACGQLANKGA